MLAAFEAFGSYQEKGNQRSVFFSLLRMTAIDKVRPTTIPAKLETEARAIRNTSPRNSCETQKERAAEGSRPFSSLTSSAGIKNSVLMYQMSD